MASHKYIDRICLAGALFSLLLSLLFVNGEALGVRAASRAMGYEDRLFDTSRVHTIDLVMDDWDGFLETCENEEYSACAAVIDGEAYRNVALRAKGNTSLTTVSSMGSDRYSFKLEFDHYDSGKTYHGLDKLCLNNLIQDNTCMKDYLTCRLMGQFGVHAPLCSYAFLTVNGEDWGLYLAVEGVEDGFLQRNYGADHGNLYKPDSMGFGGGRGNGRDFDMGDFMNLNRAGQDGAAPGLPSAPDGENTVPSPGGFGGGMGSGDVKLQYSDDDPDSYANIFGNAKTGVTEADQARLIQSLKTLSQGGDISGAVDMDQVLRYFVVHNFVVNGDSYTGSMVHNYYLYEQDGLLSMLPWDYNLAFGTFQGGSAAGAVNDPIDTPLSVTGDGSRPMIDWIFSTGEYTELYHQYFREFLDAADPAAIIGEAYDLIAPYVERDPTKFCTVEEFDSGVEALRAFCALRAESVSGQLSGAIPSTGAGQAADGSALVDASSLTLSDMGSMNSGGGRGGFGGENSAPFDAGNVPAFGGAIPSLSGGGERTQPGVQFPGGGQRPDGAEGGGFGGLPGGGPEGQAPGGNTARGQGGASLPLLAASVLVLLLGLLAAFRFPRRGDTRRKKRLTQPVYSDRLTK